ncbi:putative reverse transcriptase, RNA-dependent DNA polymerase [Tanacetum coccineum]
MTLRLDESTWSHVPCYVTLTALGNWGTMRFDVYAGYHGRPWAIGGIMRADSCADCTEHHLTWGIKMLRLVPSCCVIFDLEPLSLFFDFVFTFEIFKSLSFSLDRLYHLAILCLDQHAHTLHHRESLLTISLDRLDILKKDLFEHEHVVMNPTSVGMGYRHHRITYRIQMNLLDRKIEEEVYVCQPPGFEDPYFPNKVAKVEKALYGLHQAPRAWTSIKQKSDGIFISQDKYVAEILKKFDFALVKTQKSTLMETNKAFVKDEEAKDVDVHLYRSMMYLTASRPDIMFAICACARFKVTLKTSHFNAMKRIFRYLKGQPKLGLWYPRDSPFNLEAFSDSDYAGASLDRKSTIGGCQFLGKRLISWKCKKQTIVANPTTEAKYVAAANCCGQVLWIQNQMLDCGFNFMNTKIHIDSEIQSVLMKNPRVSLPNQAHRDKATHIINDSYEKKLIQVIKIHTDQTVADLLTLSLLIVLVMNRGEEEEDESKKKRLKEASEKTQEKNSADTEVLLEEETLTELIEDIGSGEKGEKEVSTADVPVSTAGAEVSTSTHDVITGLTFCSTLVYIRKECIKGKDKGNAINART